MEEFKKLRREKQEDIKRHPEKHRHNYNALLQCCIINEAIDTSLIQAHGELVDLGTNGGVKCDVISGPCACGAWH